jgi:hypothetical protein
MEDLPRKTRSQALESHRNDLYCDLQLRMTNDLGVNDQWQKGPTFAVSAKFW